MKINVIFCLVKIGKHIVFADSWTISHDEIEDWKVCVNELWLIVEEESKIITVLIFESKSRCGGGSNFG